MSRVEDLGEAGHELGHDRGEDLVPCCQEQSCGRRISSVFDRLVFAGEDRVARRNASRCNLRYSASHIGQLSPILLVDSNRKGQGILPNFAVERIHLLNRITLELSVIQRLHSKT